MARAIFSTEDAPAPVAAYSQGARIGNVVAVAGQVGMTREGETASGIEAQTRQALDNIAAILAAAGAGLDDILQVRVFLTDKENFGPMNAAYSEYFDAETAPVRTTVYVGLPRDLLVEIDVLAVLDG